MDSSEIYRYSLYSGITFQVLILLSLNAVEAIAFMTIVNMICSVFFYPLLFVWFVESGDQLPPPLGPHQ